MRNVENIRAILESCKTESADYYTHVSMIDPLGKFKIERDQMEEFWKEYCKAIQKIENPLLGIAEKPKTILPVLCDIDIKKREDELPDTSALDDPLYTDDHVMTMVKIYQSVFKDVLQDPTDEHYICFVLEKDPYLKEQNGVRYVKNGFHLHFPYVFLKQDEHKNVIIPKVKKLAKDLKVFASIGFENSDELVDDAVCRNAWLLYGSIKSEDQKPYQLSHIFDKNGDEMELEDALKNYKLYDMDEELIDLKGMEWVILPRILSIHPFGREASELKQVVQPFEKKKKIMSKNVTEYTVSEDLKLAKELLHMLNKKRAQTYSDWIEMKFILYNISRGSSDGLSLFLEFSSWCKDKFNEDACINEWEKTIMKEDGGKGIGSLRFYAKKDSPEKYKQLFEKKANKFIMDCIKSGGADNDIAKALFEMYGETIKCAGLRDNRWYVFSPTEHRWKRDEEGTTLRRKISDELAPIFINIAKKMLDEAKDLLEDGNKEAQKYHESKKNAVQKIIFNLKKATFKNNVMKEAKEIFYDPNFMKILDKNKYLFCFKNGVYDLKANLFREGMPDDYLSMSAGVAYKEYKDTDKEVEEVYDFLEKVFPDKELRQYIMNIMCQVFEGGNSFKKVFFWSGTGDNGKSITESMFEKMLGEYSIKLPTSFLTGKRSASGSAQPELARAGGGVRWVVMQEPGEKEEINVGILKEMSGNDSFYCRTLFSEGSEIEPLFKIAVVCNDPPAIPPNDKAAWNRIRMIPFESKFVDNPPATFEEQLKQKIFAKDSHFADKIPNLLAPFAWVLLEHRKKGLPLIEPAKVVNSTREYLVRNDVYSQFIDDRIVVDSDGWISLGDLYTLFKDWYKECVPNATLPSKNEVKIYFEKIWKCPPIKNKWKGYRERTTVDDEEEEEALANGEAFVV